MSARRADATDPQQSAQEVIFDLALSYLASRSLHVANELGIADLLKDGPQGIEELARATGAQQQSLYRLLRMLASHGAFAEESPGRFRLTAAAALLQREVPGSPTRCGEDGRRYGRRQIVVERCGSSAP
jgi:predicted transcriptional regulator